MNYKWNRLKSKAHFIIGNRNINMRVNFLRNSLRIINHEWEKSGAHPLICNLMHDFYFVFRNIEFFFLVLNQQTLCSLHTRWLYAWLEPYVFYWSHTLHFPHRDPPWYTSPNHKTTSPQLRQIILRFFQSKHFWKRKTSTTRYCEKWIRLFFNAKWYVFDDDW